MIFHNTNCWLKVWIIVFSAILWPLVSQQHICTLRKQGTGNWAFGGLLLRQPPILGWHGYFSHRVVGATGDIPDHHVGDRHNLAVLWFFNENGNAARDDLAVKLNTLGASNEFPITVVTCNHTEENILQKVGDAVSNGEVQTLLPL